MPLSARQTAELRVLLRRLAAAHAIATIPAGAGKALEAWTFMMLADAARRTPGWNVSLHQGDGSPLPNGSPFIFSGNPSGLSRTIGDTCFARLCRAGDNPRALELHHGLQHKGRSNARHEWDVALLPEQVTAQIRASNIRYPRGLPFIGIECKDKAASGSSDEMRQTLARMFDLAHVSQLGGPLRHRLLDENNVVGVGKRWPSYRQNFSKGVFGIVRMGGFQFGAHQMSDHYSIMRFGQINVNARNTATAIKGSMAGTLGRIDTLY